MKGLAALLVLAAVGLSACGGGGSTANSQPGPAPVTTVPPPPTGVNFTNFVKDLVKDQSDMDSPLTVTAGEFVYPDNEQPLGFSVTTVQSGP